MRSYICIGVDGPKVSRVGVAGGNQRQNVVTNNRPNSAFNVIEFTGQIDEARLAKRQANVAGNAIVVTITIIS